MQSKDYYIAYSVGVISKICYSITVKGRRVMRDNARYRGHNNHRNLYFFTRFRLKFGLHRNTGDDVESVDLIAELKL